MVQKNVKNFIKMIIALILISVVAIMGIKYLLDFFKQEQVKNVQADLLLIQNKVEMVEGNYKMNKDESPLKGYKLTEIPEEINISEFLNKNIISEEEYEKYYLLDSTSLEQLGLQEINNTYKGYFIVNYENYDVIYSEGYQNENGIWCYRLSELEKQPEGEKKDNQEQSNQNVENGEQNQEQQVENSNNETQTTENQVANEQNQEQSAENQVIETEENTASSEESAQNQTDRKLAIVDNKTQVIDNIEKLVESNKGVLWKVDQIKQIMKKEETVIVINDGTKTEENEQLEENNEEIINIQVNN